MQKYGQNFLKDTEEVIFFNWRNIAKVKSNKGRYLKSKRQSTVEPVFVTLTQFMGFRKINIIGIQQANKAMHLSAMAYVFLRNTSFIKQKSLKRDFLDLI